MRGFTSSIEGASLSPLEAFAKHRLREGVLYTHTYTHFSRFFPTDMGGGVIHNGGFAKLLYRRGFAVEASQSPSFYRRGLTIPGNNMPPKELSLV